MGGGASINADMQNGLGTPNINAFDTNIRADVQLVFDHQPVGSNVRSELANVQFRNGSLDANIKWKQLGDVLSNVNPFGNGLAGPIDIV